MRARKKYTCKDPDPLVVYDDDPENDTVHHPYTAFNQGFEARERDRSVWLNPYPEGSREWHTWNEGWEYAGIGLHDD